MLISAAERVRSGDLGVRVQEAATGDELAGLSRAFNRMTGQPRSAAHRVDGRLQPDRRTAALHRNRFGWAYPPALSALMRRVGLNCPIAQPTNFLASIYWPRPAILWQRLCPSSPRCSPKSPHHRKRREQLRSRPVPANHRRILLVRIGAELSAGRTDGFVVTFDDITELQSAQRKAAWADVARRIAHESRTR